jgi:predicted phosphohydrolase
MFDDCLTLFADLPCRKALTPGNHDRWALDDVQFTARVVAKLERDLQAALEAVARAIVITHHPPFHGLSFESTETPLPLDGLLWEAFCGNHALEEVLQRHADRIPFAFCGHTHRARENTFGPIHGYNIGGDYSTKRLLVLDWPEGKVTAHEFEDVSG